MCCDKGFSQGITVVFQYLFILFCCLRKIDINYAGQVVLATNIAETSLTIEDVVYVVDSGKLKERRYDAGRGMSLLVEDFVSRASALQRKGRAGRVRAGHCFGLYTRHRFEQRLRKFQVPSLRKPLSCVPHVRSCCGGDAGHGARGACACGTASGCTCGTALSSASASSRSTIPQWSLSCATCA